MAATDSIDVLNRLLAIEYRSLPMYLQGGGTWMHRGDEQIATAVARITADQQQMAARVSGLIQRRGETPELGLPRMDFTNTHFLALEFLVERLLTEASRDIAAIQQCVAELADDVDARELAQEVLGSERAHLEALEALTKQPA